MDEKKELGEKPLQIHIHVAKRKLLLNMQMMSGETMETELETAFRMVEETKKIHPNAEISIEVEA